MSDLINMMQRANAQNNPMSIKPVAPPPSLLGQVYQAYTQPSIFSPSNQQQSMPQPQTDTGKNIAAALSLLHPQPNGGAGKGGGSVTGAVSNVAKLLTL